MLNQTNTQCLDNIILLTCSSLIIRGVSIVSPAISYKLSTCPQQGPVTGLSAPVPSPPGAREHRSTPTQLLSTDAGKGAKSEANESFGSSGTGEMCCEDPATSGQGLRITPALVLLGIHRAKKSAWER